MGHGGYGMGDGGYGMGDEGYGMGDGGWGVKWEQVEKYRQSQGKLPVCEGCMVWCYLIPSFFQGVDKYWWPNQVTYASEFLARKQFLQRA